jgi:kynurenine 3-monooxygenase
LTEFKILHSYREQLISVFFGAQPLPLISIKCNPYNYSDKVLLMGDAAHAMVPFYGQGMNCGFEDCVILDELLEEHNNSIRKVVPMFSESRIENCHTIIDLAMYNYIEMRDLVNSRTFLIRKKFDSLLNTLLPKHWIPLYSMVTFTRIPYKKCLKDRQWQDLMIARTGKLCLLAILAAFAYNTFRTGKISVF